MVGSELKGGQPVGYVFIRYFKLRHLAIEEKSTCGILLHLQFEVDSICGYELVYLPYALFT